MKPVDTLRSMTPRHDEAGDRQIGAPTVEQLIRYAARASKDAGVPFAHSTMTRRIRRAYRASPVMAATAIDIAIARRAWAGFELYTAAGYADPTGAEAARRVDLAVQR